MLMYKIVMQINSKNNILVIINLVQVTSFKLLVNKIIHLFHVTQ